MPPVRHHLPRAWAAGLGAALAVLAGGCSGDSTAAVPENGEGVSIGVRVVPVRRGDIRSVVRAVGTLTAVREATVSSRVAGRIATFPLDVGDATEAGAVVVELEPEEFALAVLQAEAAVRSAAARLEGAKLLRGRTQELSSQSIASPQSLDMAANAESVAAAGVAEARAALAIARDHMAQSVIRAPLAGRVAHTHANTGEWIAPGQPLLHLVNLDTIEVDVTVSEKRIADIRAGQAVTVRVDGFPARTFSGAVHSLSPTVDPVSRTFTVTVRLENPEGRLRPGMFARVEIAIGQRSGTLILPRHALLEREGTLWAVRITSGRAERVSITPGYRYGDRVEVLDGLSEGDQVVIEGAYGLANGAKVHVTDTG